MVNKNTNNWLSSLTCQGQGVFVSGFLIGFIFWSVGLPVQATRLSVDLIDSIVRCFPASTIRLDGAIQTKDGELFLPLIPNTVSKYNSTNPPLPSYFPNRQDLILLSFSDGWNFVRLRKFGQFRTIILPESLPDQVRQLILKTRLPADLIVPEHFVIPNSLKPLMGDLSIPSLPDATIAASDFGLSKDESKSGSSKHGVVFVLSPNAGKITMLDEGSLKKLTEFPIEGTPSGITHASGLIYIADQSKNRILKLDPSRRLFVGQINLPGHSAPKGVAALPDGKLIYVSESATNSISVFQTDSDKLLIRMKVLVGPTRLAVSPDGKTLLILSASTGKALFISTETQKILGAVQVGAFPDAIYFSNDSQRVYICNRASNSVSIIDTDKRRLLSNLITGQSPTGLCLDANGSRLFVANAKDDTISVFELSTNKKLEDIKLPLDLDFPGQLILMPDQNHILVSSETTEAVGILNTSNLKFEGQPSIGHTSDVFLCIQVNEG